MSWYFRDLAARLRLLNLPETDVAAVVVRAEELVRQDGRTPELVLGPVDDYVDSFVAPTRRSLETRVVRGLFGALGAVTAIYLVLRLVVPSIDHGWRVGVYGFLAGFVVLTAAGLVVGHRRPRSRR